MDPSRPDTAAAWWLLVGLPLALLVVAFVAGQVFHRVSGGPLGAGGPPGSGDGAAG